MHTRQDGSQGAERGFPVVFGLDSLPTQLGKLAQTGCGAHCVDIPHLAVFGDMEQRRVAAHTESNGKVTVLCCVNVAKVDAALQLLGSLFKLRLEVFAVSAPANHTWSRPRGWVAATPRPMKHQGLATWQQNSPRSGEGDHPGPFCRFVLEIPARQILHCLPAMAQAPVVDQGGATKRPAPRYVLGAIKGNTESATSSTMALTAGKRQAVLPMPNEREPLMWCLSLAVPAPRVGVVQMAKQKLEGRASQVWRIWIDHLAMRGSSLVEFAHFMHAKRMGCVRGCLHGASTSRV